MGTDQEIERERQERIEDFEAEDGTEWAESYLPGSFGCHELYDRTMLAFNLVEEMILSHPACVRDPAWFSTAYHAFRALETLYEKIGEAHTPDDDDLDQELEGEDD